MYKKKSVKTANGSAIGRHVAAGAIMSVVEGTIVTGFCNGVWIRFKHTHNVLLYIGTCERHTIAGVPFCRCHVARTSTYVETSVSVLSVCIMCVCLSLSLCHSQHISNRSYVLRIIIILQCTT